MHLRFAPSKSGAHRLACTSLYRAFLRQCNTFPTPTTSSDNGPAKTYNLRATLRSLVKHRFEQDKRLKVHIRIRDALKFGRETLQLLENAAQGSTQALTEMTRILSASASTAAQRSKTFHDLRLERTERVGLLPSKLAARKQREERHHRIAEPDRRPKPSTIPVLDRPAPYERALKHKDGRRVVPTYFVAQGIPFLRYTKKQPPALGHLIARQIRNHEKGWDLRHQMEDTVSLAEAEDEWDRHLARTQSLSSSDSLEDADRSSDTWATAHVQVLEDSKEKSRAGLSKRVEHGNKLFDVFLKEKVLARIENVSRGLQKGELASQSERTESDEHEKNGVTDAPARTEDGNGRVTVFRPFS